MTNLQHPWPTIDTPAFRRLTEIFRPVFSEIAKGSRQRDATRTLPHAEVARLKELKFGAMLLPEDKGGSGATPLELFALLIELAEADSNVAQIFRAHFGLLGQLIDEPSNAWTKRCIDIIGSGELISAAATEVGNAALSKFSTSIAKTDEGHRLNGQKFYTTGALFSEWMTVSGLNNAGESIMALVKTTVPGTSIVDDWNGFGQRLTASGTAVFDQVLLDDNDIAPSASRWPFLTAFAQLAHLATLVGIGRAASNAVAEYVRSRKRTYSHAAASIASDDPQVLQLVGKVFANAHGANSVVLSAADAYHRTIAQGLTDRTAVGELEVQIYQSQVVVHQLILDATTVLFDGLGASALSNELGLDRYWRNARAISSHNPVIYKERQIGDFAVNGSLPPDLWTTGIGKA
ncbi:acyl-CoA dehydrogenase family protein [Agrobacterium tumefaciens]|uniref:acyl-CoA dehydrogenase family protein n=1 Tax=Agrobacterium tumefaciens TaxID=358 RepID=UPI0021D29CE3|nr:acyl-CoA dehydrogenase family protein [Agrobacterium tumefaciens]NTZ64065.1 acyl-CoA dehydrogenase family protein [Agrobacterium tumefaciens]UXT00218.1 acyl-CoA dehydrogenase family protein [Agrobacterium tumefaciens]UXT52918.1 acyl-CoA dehydrogenase family protein [Agrobacterium tumefaciens]